VALVLDTGPIFASIDRRDAAHEACRQLFTLNREPLVIPAPVVGEVDYWIRKWLHPGALLAFLDDITAGAYAVENLQPQDYLRIREILSRYADANIGFVDAAVLAVVERLNEPKLATLDRRHFAMFRPRHVDALILLPE
jgi:predicted nucleic acid-binding protein